MVAEWSEGRTTAGGQYRLVELPEKIRIDFAPDDLQSDYMRALHEYWNAARGAADLPPVSAIDPMLLPRACLPYLSVLEVEQAPFRLRSRLSGTALVAQFGTDFTGRYLDELPGMDAQLTRMKWCVETRHPYVVEDKLTFAPKDYKLYQTLILPFGDPEAGVQRIVGVFTFEKSDSKPSWTR